MSIQPFQTRRPSLGSRAFDVVVASIGLLFLSPLLLLVTLAILIESGRPVFFAQTRLGQDGRHFRLFKFRKFKKCAVEAGRPLTVRGDDRMSPVGRILEAKKLDELPQLYNILKGEMSIVGPRPESLAFEDCFDDAHRAVLGYRPGIFGPSQVAFRDEGALYPPGAEPARLYRQVLFPTKARLDLAYYPNRTLLSDIGWILCGVLAVVGLYKTQVGPSMLAAGQSSAMGAAGSRNELGGAPSFTVQI
ncbi:sugar transferase [Falsiroseomonas sp. HC035]|uniref:sugar transferase n=1 Tax=Falsiroseomonas sp. HC035 TaxID=3390999 RepID=UPI003D320C0D